MFNYNGSISICQAKVYKLRTQYRGKQFFAQRTEKTVLDSFDGDEETSVIIRFIELLCDHLDADFKQSSQLQQQILNMERQCRSTDEKILHRYIKLRRKSWQESKGTNCIANTYFNIMAEEVETSEIKTFIDVVNMLKDEKFN